MAYEEASRSVAMILQGSLIAPALNYALLYRKSADCLTCIDIYNGRSQILVTKRLSLCTEVRDESCGVAIAQLIGKLILFIIICMHLQNTRKQVARMLQFFCTVVLRLLC